MRRPKIKRKGLAIKAITVGPKPTTEREVDSFLEACIMCADYWLSGRNFKVKDLPGEERAKVTALISTYRTIAVQMIGGLKHDPMMQQDMNRILNKNIGSTLWYSTQYENNGFDDMFSDDCRVSCSAARLDDLARSLIGAVRFIATDDNQLSITVDMETPQADLEALWNEQNAQN